MVRHALRGRSRVFGRSAACRVLAAGLLGASAAAVVAAPAEVLAQETDSAVRAFSIPPQGLDSAMSAFARTTRIQVLTRGATTRSVTSPGARGEMTPEQALRAILAGTGLVAEFAGGNTVTVIDPRVGLAGTSTGGNGETIQLETITVTGGGKGSSPKDLPYETPGSVSYISEEQIERFRGTSPGDIFKNAPGVLSGENRNSGAVDVNIRGMQGVGRVPVTVDGAQNVTTVYRGYQGVGSRTFIDPDFIGGIEIEKGPSFGAGGTGAIGGIVRMSTITPDDILLDGKDFGGRVKFGQGTNTTEPVDGKRSQMNPLGTGFTSDDIERPGVLDPTSGSGSAVIAGRSDIIDFVAGYSRRIAGNYHAGENGSGAAKDVGPQTICGGAGCQTYEHYYPSAGLTPYLPGEEVLNTSSDTESTLLKGKLKLGDGHTLDLGYSYSQSEFGETYPTGLTSPTQTVYQGILSNSQLNSVTARYHWDPSTTNLIDLRWNAFRTSLEEYSRQSNTGLVGVGKWVDMTGTDVTNTSVFDTGLGEVSVQLGGSYLEEATGPTEDSTWWIPPPREGERWQASGFSFTQWSPTDWLTLDNGLRYQRFRTTDKLVYDAYRSEPRSGDAFDYSFGATVTPFDGIQLFGSYKEASRLPSLLESSGGFLLVVDPNLGPERAHNWEFGVNVLRDGLISEGDHTGIKFSFFDNTIDDYISRKWTGSILQLVNVEQARFQGLELSGRYEKSGFTAELAATYYTEVEFCRTKSTCMNSSLASDYATNYIPPEYNATLTLSQKLFDDALTIGGRVSHTGPRAAAAETPASGAAPLIAMINWKPYTLVDLFADYDINENFSFELSVENLTDIYYVEPLSLALVPSPGRTIRVGLTGRF
ncbi:TonB-dependent receptor [Flaviflagellibacter deserti]|uniref:TonB-dependent receptor domain-containing protein n=1 Tax=Flaviflagellibacter deserti TaxID=2267266 RepID=A0ABV9Z0M1_9HYPH